MKLSEWMRWELGLVKRRGYYTSLISVIRKVALDIERETSEELVFCDIKIRKKIKDNKELYQRLKETKDESHNIEVGSWLEKELEAEIRESIMEQQMGYKKKQDEEEPGHIKRKGELHVEDIRKYLEEKNIDYLKGNILALFGSSITKKSLDNIIKTGDLELVPYKTLQDVVFEGSNPDLSKNLSYFVKEFWPRRRFVGYEPEHGGFLKKYVREGLEKIVTDKKKQREILKELGIKQREPKIWRTIKDESKNMPGN